MHPLFHLIAVEYDARGKTDHQPIEPQQKDDHNRQRAVQLFGVGKPQINRKGKRCRNPGERREETAERRIGGIRAIRTDIPIQQPGKQKRNGKSERIAHGIGQIRRIALDQKIDGNEHAARKRKQN